MVVESGFCHKGNGKCGFVRKFVTEISRISVKFCHKGNGKCGFVGILVTENDDLSQDSVTR
ncbi:MAG: hypothetical protein IJ535_00880 [Pseudobutyrivibrio sp.]|uniref:hypothetical protein n=1 Tax=Pseudobutyrivibrio sp. TaxID=2014367 RepID=UPI0025F90495|nr:hypothetical protein [Pseudobutyrivibrio sp.]MBQ8488313.1 hypothetical protein [Pseudobutyrivibrio sp.]